MISQTRRAKLSRVHLSSVIYDQAIVTFIVQVYVTLSSETHDYYHRLVIERGQQVEGEKTRCT